MIKIILLAFLTIHGLVEPSFADSEVPQAVLPPDYKDPPGIRTMGCWGIDGFKYRKINVPPKMYQVEHFEKYNYSFILARNSKLDSAMCRKAIDEVKDAIKAQPNWSHQSWDIKVEAILVRCC